MTREDIINEIKPILEELNYPDAVSYLTQNDRGWLEENIRALEQEPCEDAISRQAAIRIAEQGQVQGYEWQFKELVKLPPVNSQPKIGHWIIIDDCEKFIAKCSECGQIEDSRMIGKYAYCHCGAKMIEPQERGEQA